MNDKNFKIREEKSPIESLKIDSSPLINKIKDEEYFFDLKMHTLGKPKNNTQENRSENPQGGSQINLDNNADFPSNRNIETASPIIIRNSNDKKSQSFFSPYLKQQENYNESVLSSFHFHDRKMNSKLRFSKLANEENIEEKFENMEEEFNNDKSPFYSAIDFNELSKQESVIRKNSNFDSNQLIDKIKSKNCVSNSMNKGLPLFLNKNNKNIDMKMMVKNIKNNNNNFKRYSTTGKNENLKTDNNKDGNINVNKNSDEINQNLNEKGEINIYSNLDPSKKDSDDRVSSDNLKNSNTNNTNQTNNNNIHCNIRYNKQNSIENKDSTCNNFFGNFKPENSSSFGFYNSNSNNLTGTNKHWASDFNYGSYIDISPDKSNANFNKESNKNIIINKKYPKHLKSNEDNNVNNDINFKSSLGSNNFNYFNYDIKIPKRTFDLNKNKDNVSLLESKNKKLDLFDNFNEENKETIKKNKNNIIFSKSNLNSNSHNINLINDSNLNQSNANTNIIFKNPAFRDYDYITNLNGYFSNQVNNEDNNNKNYQSNFLEGVNNNFHYNQNDYIINSQNQSSLNFTPIKYQENFKRKISNNNLVNNKNNDNSNNNKKFSDNFLNNGYNSNLNYDHIQTSNNNRDFALRLSPKMSTNSLNVQGYKNITKFPINNNISSINVTNSNLNEVVKRDLVEYISYLEKNKILKIKANDKNLIIIEFIETESVEQNKIKNNDGTKTNLVDYENSEKEHNVRRNSNDHNNLKSIFTNNFKTIDVQGHYNGSHINVKNPSGAIKENQNNRIQGSFINNRDRGKEVVQKMDCKSGKKSNSNAIRRNLKSNLSYNIRSNSEKSNRRRLELNNMENKDIKNNTLTRSDFPKNNNENHFKIIDNLDADLNIDRHNLNNYDNKQVFKSPLNKNFIESDKNVIKSIKTKNLKNKNKFNVLNSLPINHNLHDIKNLITKSSSSLSNINTVTSQKKETTSSSGNIPNNTAGNSAKRQNSVHDEVKEAIHKYKKMKQFETETLEKIKDYDLFYDIPCNRDLMGDFLDKIIEGSIYMYKNRNCHSCSKLLSAGEPTTMCPKEHHALRY